MHKIYISKSYDPTFNLAVEEYLVKHSKPEDRILYFWQNDQTIVIGRNQNPWKECHWNKLNADGGTLVRRPSGGGAVYHDLGNLNFTFISENDDSMIDANIDTVVKTLKELGFNAAFSGKNDILVDGLKVSGNAYFVEGDILCLHGTLLVDADMTRLQDYLKVSELKLKSKGIDSVRSRVVNLKALDDHVTVDVLRDAVSSGFSERYGQCTIQTIDEVTRGNLDQEKLNGIIEKYRSWDWNFGSSPQFDIQFTERFPWGEVELNLAVADGIIDDIKVYTDAMDAGFSEQLERILSSVTFEKTACLRALKSLDHQHKGDLVRWVKGIEF